MAPKARTLNYFALAIGLIAAVGAAFSIRAQLTFIASSVTTNGKVIRLTYGPHHPEIDFVTQAGEHVRFPGSFVSAEVGDSIPVRYDPAMPRASATIDNFSNVWLEPVMLCVFTAVFLYAGATGQRLGSRYG